MFNESEYLVLVTLGRQTLKYRQMEQRTPKILAVALFNKLRLSTLSKRAQAVAIDLLDNTRNSKDTVFFLGG